MKMTFSNSFHNTEITTNIKNDIIEQAENNNYDIIEYLEYLSWNSNQYAIKKIKTINSALCGMNDCSCSGFINVR